MSSSLPTLRDTADPMTRPGKVMVTIRLDRDLVERFKSKGRGYQTRINQTLREMMMEELNSHDSAKSNPKVLQFPSSTAVA